MTDRQFFWGLSNGIIVLAIAGTFWLGMAIGPHFGEVGWGMAAAFTLVLYGPCAWIIWLAIRLRLRFGFKRSELKQGDERQRAETHRIMVGFIRIVIAQTVFIALAVPLCLRLDHEELLGPWIGLIVSFHFIPLGRIFHVRTYYVVGIIGSAISLVAFSALFGVGRLMFLGGTMCVLLWLSAAYILWRADRIGAKAIHEGWRV